MNDTATRTFSARLFTPETPHSAYGATGANICHAIDGIDVNNYPGLSLAYVTETLAGEKLDIPEFTYHGWTIRLQSADGVTVARNDVVHRAVDFVATCTQDGAARHEDVYNMLRIVSRRHSSLYSHSRGGVLTKTPALYEVIDSKTNYETAPQP